MIALNKNELLILAKIYAASLLIFTIVFYKEPMLSLVRLTLSLAAISYVPGYLLTEKIFETNAQRLLIGSAISTAIIGISAYYLGIFGVPLSLSAYILPAVLIMFGAAVSKFY
ncbi:MAG: hypothetical protein HY363_02355 [Candidatus Aenigmarchaeota archaeon]|nr:hypothetical protein [Candidatus Aenigmarchaeota archaeon]